MNEKIGDCPYLFIYSIYSPIYSPIYLFHSPIYSIYSFYLFIYSYLFRPYLFLTHTANSSDQMLRMNGIIGGK
jgi:hypothetical protein